MFLHLCNLEVHSAYDWRSSNNRNLGYLIEGQLENVYLGNEENNAIKIFLKPIWKIWKDKGQTGFYQSVKLTF